jgi:hypothetical protein
MNEKVRLLREVGSVVASDGGIPERRTGTTESGPADSAPVTEQEALARVDELRAELALLRTILALTSARIAYVARDGRILRATPAFARAAGVEPGELIGRTIEQTKLPVEARQRVEALRAVVVDSGKPARTTVSVTHEGITRDTELVIQPAYGPAAPIDGVVVTALDVTELSQAMRRVAQLDRVYAILSGTNQAIVRIHDRDQILQEACRIAAEVGGFELAWVGLVDPNGDVTVAARAGRAGAILDDLVVSARDEPSGRGVVGTAIREKHSVVIDEAVSDERMAPWRAQLIARGFSAAAAFPLSIAGSVVGAFAMYSSQPGYFDADEVRLFEELASDISLALESLEAERGRTMAEQALRDSEQRYRDLFEKSPHSMWVYDLEGLGFLAVNDAALYEYGYSRDEFLSMTLSDIRPPEDIPAMLATVAAAGTAFRPRRTWRHRRKDGSIMDVEVTGHDIEFHGRKGRLIAVADVTDRKRLQAQLSEATRMEAMGHLAGGIAHDFNNLLTAVNGYAELLVAELGDSPMAEDARQIRRAGQRAAELTRQVLAFARRQVLAPRAVDVNNIVVGVSQMLGRLIGEQIRLVTVLDHEPAVIIADPGQIEQVLVNLGINARDAMPDGGTLEIRVARIEDGAALGRELDGPAVLLTVTDTGSGMDAQTLARAFEPFFTTKQAGSGTGLGLATVHGIVHQSSGEVWAESTVGRGTCVSVLFRRVEAEPENIPEPPIIKTPAARSATVLVVEDEPGVRGFVVATLERARYHVLVAGSPAEAVALTEGLDDRIDVLVTDLIMPGTNGQVLAERLVARRPSMRVVLMSGYGASLEASSEGGYRFLAKPFGRDDLIAVVATALAEGEIARS